jgi:unsaturated rhamnogalacturonyl hydrolase
LPVNHPDRDDLITILQKTCDALLKVRDQKSGIWYQVLNHGGRKGNYLEGSGSAMYTYVFAKGARLGYLDKKYRDIANSAFDGIIKNLITVNEKGYGYNARYMRRMRPGGQSIQGRIVRILYK